MVLKSLELSGFKSFAKKTTLSFETKVTGIVGPNGSGKSNVVEAIRFVLGEQSMKSLRGKGGSDLIFKGSKDLSALSRASVTISFDNANRVFSFTETEGGTRSVDFDEIRITREVYSDGQNRYLINGSEVRLKDIVELLASVHVGASGHHIISQGEADRILSSSNKDRRIMIEDALGLKIYQYRIKESERRLERTEINMKEVAGLRRELAPHLGFLKKQVEKIEKAEEVRKTLEELYRSYFSTALWLEEKNKKEIDHDMSVLNAELTDLEKKLEESRPKEERTSPHEARKKEINQALIILENKKNTITHEIGRVEGMIDGLSRLASSAKDEVPISKAVVRETLGHIKDVLKKALEAEDTSLLRTYIKDAVLLIDTFETRAEEEGGAHSTSTELETLKETKNSLLESLTVIEKEKIFALRRKRRAKRKRTSILRQRPRT
jgi:chromosome segregation protein